MNPALVTLAALTLIAAGYVLLAYIEDTRQGDNQ